MRIAPKRKELEPGCPIPGCGYCEERVAPTWCVAACLLITAAGGGLLFWVAL